MDLKDALKNRGGRPSKGLSEDSTLIRAPTTLLERVKAAAAEEGIPASEWWRKAAEERLAKAEADSASPK